MLADDPRSRAHPGSALDPSEPIGEVRRNVLAMITDGTGRLAFANRDLLDIGGWQWREVAGREWCEVFVAERDRAAAKKNFAAAIAGNGEVAHVEIPICGRDGRTHVIAWSASPSRDGAGTPVSVTSVGIDITKWADERDRLAAQRNFEESHDVLTGLVNANTFRFQLGVELAAIRNTGRNVAVLLIGIDRFRGVIETLGHEAGDSLLREVATRVDSCAPGRAVARWTGDEFAVMLPGLESGEEAIEVANAVIEAMTPPCTSCGTSFHLGASVGLVVAPRDGDNPATLMRHAAIAMGKAKSEGRQRYALFHAALSSQARERLLMEQQLHGALARREITLVYQPQVDAENLRVMGAEALARWHNPVLGEVSPSEFIPMAEQAGIIPAIGRFVLEQALVQAAEWRAEGLGDLPIAVNVSAYQLVDSDFVNDVRRLLEETNTPPQLLELEVTETAAMVDVGSAAEILRQLAALGTTISLDDFGTGYSCLGKLHELSVSTIKIDRSFLSSESGSSDPGTLLTALIALGKAMHLRVIAEGVETLQQLSLLKGQGLDAYQGFLFARPLTADEMRQVLMESRPIGIGAENRLSA